MGRGRWAWPAMCSCIFLTCLQDNKSTPPFNEADVSEKPKSFIFPSKRVNPKMSFFCNCSNLSTSFCLLILPLFFTLIHATTFEIRNSCPYTVWAAAVPGGGRQLDQGQTWKLSVSSNITGRIWGRTKCSFDEAGRGSCESGGCGGLLECQEYGSPPNTIAEGANCTGDINGPCPNELRDPGGCNNPCTVFKNSQYCCTPGICGPTTYSEFFKDRCPNAYSYPEDDDSTSLFTCSTGSNYRVVFCP
ncbi:hypothetical protein AAG906_033433 [Vitis piasezkii]